MTRKYVEDNKHKGVLMRFLSTPPAPTQEGGEGPFSTHNMPREGRLALARNLALAELSTMPVTDYVIMIDMDIIGWDINGIIDSFSQRVPVVSSDEPISSPNTTSSSSESPGRVRARYTTSDTSVDHTSVGVSDTGISRHTGEVNNQISETEGESEDDPSVVSSGNGPNSDSTKNKKHKWDVICSNGIILHGVYRDIYAFRVGNLNTNHHWAGQDGADYGLADSDLARRRQDLNVRILKYC